MFDQEYVYPGTGVTCRRHALDQYDIDLIEGDKTAFFTFFAADIDSRKRLPWGASFLRAQGHTIIGIKGQGQDWFRGAELHRFLRSEEFRGFLAGFDQVVFYGASKGGYGALAFSDLVDNPIVISISPQSTLDPRLVPWERRFRVGQDQDWDGDFRDSVDSLKPGGDYNVFLDPYDEGDRKHLERLENVPNVNINVFKLPFGKHDVPGAMVKSGMLKDVVLGCRDRALTPQKFAKLARARKTQLWYLTSVAQSVRAGLRGRAAALHAAELIDPMHSSVRLARGYLWRDQGHLQASLDVLQCLSKDLTGAALRRCQTSIAAIQKKIEASSKEVDIVGEDVQGAEVGQGDDVTTAKVKDNGA